MIQLNEKIAIKADKRQFMICYKKIKKGEVYFEPTFYFSDFDYMLKKLISLAIADGIKEGSFEAVGERVGEMKHLISEKMDRIIDVSNGYAKEKDDPLTFFRNEYQDKGKGDEGLNPPLVN